MKRKIIFGLICALVLTTNVNATPDALEELAPNGIMEVNAIKPKDEQELIYYVRSKIVSAGNNLPTISNCDANLETCDIVINNQSELTESRTITFKWQEEDATIKEKVNNKIASLNGITDTIFSLEDLDLINYYYNINKSITVETAAKYNKNYKEIFKDQDNFRFSLVTDSCGGFAGAGCNGTVVIYYNNVAYSYITDLSLGYSNVIYVADTVSDTKEELIAAAKKRISDYLNNASFTLEFAEEGEFVSDMYPGSLPYYYTLTIADQKYEYVIIKNSKKINDGKLDTKDTTTNISVNTTSNEVPLDTTVSVKAVLEDSKEYTNIKEVLKVSNFKAFNISLYSETKGNITKLTNGLFEVIIPLGKEYVGKTMAAYYIKEDNTIEIHDVIMDEQGNAKFTTNHFSTYILAEKKEVEDAITEEVPKTSDNINTYFILGGIGLISLLSLSFILKKKEN